MQQEREKEFRKYATVTVGFSMLLLFVSVIMKIDITNVLLPVLEKDYGWSRVDVNGAISIGSYIAIILGFAAGSIAIKTGIKKVSFCGLILMAVGTLIMAFGQSLNSICIAFAICQASYPIVLLSCMTYLTKWYVKRRGWVLGVATMAMPITSCVYIPLGNSIISTQGKMPFYLAIAIIIIVVSVIEILFLKENPEERGVSPDGIRLSDDAKAAIAARQGSAEGGMTIKDVVKTKECWFVAIGNTCLRFMTVCLMSQFILRITDVGVPIGQAVMIMSIATAVGIVTSYLWGVLDDKIGSNKAITIFAATYIIGFIFILFATPERPILIWLSAFYIASSSGGMENLKNSIVSYVFGRRNYVSASRITSLAADLGSAFAFTFMMTIFRVYHTYDYAYMILIVIAVFATIMYSLVRRTYDAERLELIAKGQAK